VSKLKITLKKSKIGRIEKHIRTCEALGLHKIGQSVIKEDNDAVRGMIRHIAFMVDVEEVK